MATPTTWLDKDNKMIDNSGIKIIEQGDKTYKIEVTNDEFTENPLESDDYLGEIWGLSNKHSNFLAKNKIILPEGSELPDSYEECVALVRKQYPDAVALSYSEHGNCMWTTSQLQSDFDSVKHAGFWLPNDNILDDLKELTGTKRTLAMLERAKQACEAYTAWCNGDVYAVHIYELKTCNLGEQHEESIDSCGGFYDYDEAMQSGIETVAGYAPFNKATQ